jgi:hypothetical protein
VRKWLGLENRQVVVVGMADGALQWWKRGRPEVVRARSESASGQGKIEYVTEDSG